MVSLASFQMVLMLLVGDSIFENQCFGVGDGGDEVYIHSRVRYSVVSNSILFWLYILNPSLLCSLFSEAAATRQQVTHFLTPLSLSFPRDYYADHCECWHFSVILRSSCFFPGWFSLDARRCE